MADHCSFCETRWPDGGTNMLVLGDDWLEFCRPCGDTVKLTNTQTGEEATIREVFDATALMSLRLHLSEDPFVVGSSDRYE